MCGSKSFREWLTIRLDVHMYLLFNDLLILFSNITLFVFASNKRGMGANTRRCRKG